MITHCNHDNAYIIFEAGAECPLCRSEKIIVNMEIINANLEAMCSEISELSVKTTEVANRCTVN